MAKQEITIKLTKRQLYDWFRQLNQKSRKVLINKLSKEVQDSILEDFMKKNKEE